VRVPGFVVAAGLAPRVETTPVAFVDWLPTVLGRAGVDVAGHDVDGFDLWPLLAYGRAPERTGFVVHLEAERGALRRGPWKLVAEGPLADAAGDVTLALFDVVRDPAERTDRAADEPERAASMLAELRAELARAQPAEGADDPPPEGFRPPAVWGERE
jgi:arylsulfatase A-like enzyme